MNSFEGAAQSHSAGVRGGTTPDQATQVDHVTGPISANGLTQASELDPAPETTSANRPIPVTEPTAATQPDQATQPQNAAKPGTPSQTAAGPQPGALQQQTSLPDESALLQQASQPEQTSLPLLDRLPLIRTLPAGRRQRLTEIVRFLTVGCMNWVVDFAVFNLFRCLLGAPLVIVAKVISVTVATLFSWVMNRSWTFQERATNRPIRELIGFIVVNGAGMAPPLICLWISHHLMGLTSALADNISANIVGLIIGTVVRYLGYRWFVFTKTDQDAPAQAS